jgi:hypothetical protein
VASLPRRQASSLCSFFLLSTPTLQGAPQIARAAPSYFQVLLPRLFGLLLDQRWTDGNSWD